MAAVTESAAPRTGAGLVPTDLAVLAAVTVALRIPAFVAERHLTFDDGVYGASAVAMRAGGQPFRDVFSSQGPLFLPLVWLADGLGLHTTNAPRLLSLLAALLLVGSTYLAGLAVSDRVGALIAAALVSATGTSLWITGPIAADGAALALATLTIALTLRWRHEITVRRAIWMGLGVGATLSVKALLAPVILPVALVLIAARRVRPILAGALTAIAFHFLLWLPWGIGNVWAQSYEYHLEVASDRTPGANALKVLSTLGDRDLLVLVAVVVMVAAVLLGQRARRPEAEARMTSPDTILLTWLAGTALVLLTEHPMWRPHVSQLIPALALLAVRHRPATKVLLLALVVALPYAVVHAWPMLSPAGFSDDDRGVVDQLAALPEGALAISDDPGLVWRSGRRTTPDLVDASVLRIQTGDLTSASIAAAAAQDDVCAVAVRSAERWGSFDDLPARLQAAGYERTESGEGARRLYVKSDCRPDA
jgi:4-amino-4-deoxy-L-arabinose transferase-like glycosyltransferase